MELKEFIKQTIIDIGAGLQDAHKGLVSKEGKGIDDIKYMTVHFDVAVSVD